MSLAADLRPPAAPPCSNCGGMLIADRETDELVCFTCSRRVNSDGSSTARVNEKASRSGERIAGLRF